MHIIKTLIYTAGILACGLAGAGITRNSNMFSSFFEKISHPQTFEQKLASWHADPGKQVARVVYPIVEENLDKTGIRPRFLHDNEIVRRSSDTWLIMGHVETRSKSGHWQKYAFSVEMQARNGCTDYSARDCWTISRMPEVHIKQ